MSAAANRGVSGEMGQWQCLVATDRANTPATSTQFERGSAIRPDTRLSHSKVGVRVIRSINFCIMTKI